MIWLMVSPRRKRKLSTTLSTTESNSTKATGLVVKVSSAHQMWLTPDLFAPRTSKVNGVLSFRTLPTTPRLSVLRLVSSPKQLAVLWLLASTANAFRSTCTTACCPWTHAIPTKDSSSTLTSCPQPALATSQSRHKRPTASKYPKQLQRTYFRPSYDF